MTQKQRISGGLIDRSRPLSFSFDGKEYSGFSGDTLASALIANDVRLIGRSFKYHRPRGIFSAGSDEPNALVTIGGGASTTPNTRATMVELYDGLAAKSQNRWPNMKFDILSVNDLFSPFLATGFYYKTFMWPATFWERVYEPAIRRAAGLGKLSGVADPAHYDKGYLHCDILIIGGGIAGLSAALSAARAGANVIIADEGFRLGGQLLGETIGINDAPAIEWIDNTIGELNSMTNVRILTRTTVFGVFDHGMFGAVQRNTEHIPDTSNKAPRETYWKIAAKRSVLSSGAIERSIAFANNDRPGVMLASAVRSYANRHAALAGNSVLVLTNNSDGYRTARDLHQAGARVQVIDTRASHQHKDAAPLSADIEQINNVHVVKVHGGNQVSGVTLSNGEKLSADCVAVAGGWNPVVNLTCHNRGKPVWHERLACFLPDTDKLPKGMIVAGTANGAFATATASKEGSMAGLMVAKSLGFTGASTPEVSADDSPLDITPFWWVGDKSRAWVDLQNDVTTKDIKLSAQEGFKSVEHLKRYTTLGMATDQGKGSNVLGIAILANVLGKKIDETGTTIFRPPYTPVSIGAFAGHHRGKTFRPVRETPSQKFSDEQNAVMVETGLWRRAQWFPKTGEKHWRESVDREVRTVRESVGICDLTTLGKIDVQGSDAALFLDRVYTNTFSTLKIGRCRYGLMLREDGMALDDGTTARLDDYHYVMTTTTANAVSVFRHLEFCHQCLWPDLDVQLISVTEQWAQYAIAGPNSRDLLKNVVDPQHDISNDAFPFMACGELTICGGIRARLFRLSFSGELAYELAVPARYGDSLIRTLLSAGEEFGACLYGTEALGVMRIEKGHAAGNELNGQSSALNLGMGKMVSRKKDCIGKKLSERPGIQENALRLVGFKAVDADAEFGSGAHLVEQTQPALAAHDIGYLTSTAWSPAFSQLIALGYLEHGDNRIGDMVKAVDPLRNRETLLEVCSPHFVDPDGERLRG